MNKVYSKVWSGVLNQLVVASELASCRRSGRQARRTVGRSSLRRAGAGILMLLAAGSSGWVLPAQAQTVDCTASPYNYYSGSATCAGYLSQATQGGATAMGYNAHSTGLNSTTLGYQALASGVNSIYLGSRSTGTGASGQSSIAIGTDVNTGGSGAIGIGVQSKAAGLRGTALGTQANAAADYATALGGAGTGAATAVQATGVGSTAIGGNDTGGALASGKDAIAIGGQSVSSTQYSVALGLNAAASGPGGAMALGAGTVSNNINTVALGVNASATGAGASALGTGSSASGGNATAVGVGATASSNYAFSGGYGSEASALRTIAIGTNATSTYLDAIAQGTGASAGGQNAIAIGFQSIASEINSINLGARTLAGSGATAQGAIAIGTDVTASLDRAIAIGVTSKATDTDALAIGTRAAATASYATAFGAGPAAATAVMAAGIGSVAIGGNAVSGASASGANAIAMGGETVADADDAVAIGHGSTATGGKAVAVGSGNVASGNGAVAIGDPNTATGNGAIASGLDNTATGDGSVAMGNTNMVGGGGQAVSTAGTAAQGAVGIGYQNTVIGQGSVAIGNTSSALAAGAIAFGDTAVANNADDVALGSGSTTDTAVGTASYVINGTTYNFAGTSPDSTVSVGALGAERTITNVAAGRISGSSTDAVNGSQLFATNQAVDLLGTNVTNLGDTVTNLGDTIATSIGGGTTYDPSTGNLTTSITYGGNTYSSLQNVFTQIDGALGGDGIKYFHANSTLADSQATGTDSVAIGPVSNATTTDAVSIGNGATAGTNVGDVALGAGSVTGAVVQTGGATIDGNSYTYAGATPDSTVSVGAVGDERTITNVAAGQVNGSSTDAINGSQLFATNQALENLSSTVTASATHYYSVNDGGTAGGNYANDGASGLDALAAGVGASATADNGTALGQGTGVSVLGGVALGSGAVSDRAIAPTSGSILVGTNVIPYNTTDRNLLGAVSVGNATDFRQITNVADGTLDQDAVTLRQLKGAMSSFSVTPIQYFHANSTATDSAAIGAESVAIGPQTTVNGDNGIGMGNGAIVQQTAPGGTAIGQSATVNLADGVALGTNATSNGIQALALGAGTEADFAGSVALGAGSATDAAVGTPSYVINGTTYNFAGTTPGSTVSVGAVGAERTITNVAAGRIDGGSTDAINGSQLFATNQAVESIGTNVTNLGNTVTNLGDSIANSYGGSTTYDPVTGTLNTSITYGGNTYSSLQQVFSQIETGGIKYFHANSNLADSLANGLNSVAIGPVSTAGTQDAVSIGNGATAGANVGDVALGAGSVTGAVVQTGGATIDGNSYTYAGATPNSTVSVGAVGDERTITNVAAGQVNGSSTDAINGSQLFATNQALENLSSTVTANAIHYYSVNDGGTTGGNYANDGATGLDALAAGVGASAVADSGTALGENTQSTVLGGVALGSGAISDRAIAPTSGSILVGTNVIPYNTTDRTLLGAVSVGNATDFRQITNVADGTLDQDAVTLRQLKGAMSSFSVTPIKYFHANSTASDSAAIGAESVAIGPQTTVNGDNGIGLGNGAIVQQTAPGGTAIGQNATVNLADGVALGTHATSNGIQALALGAGTEADYAGSVALGAGSQTDAAVGTASTTLDGTTYNFAGATPGSTVSVGSAGAERTITNLAAGRISSTSTDAINGSQLFATNQTLEQLYSSLNNLSSIINNLPSSGPGTGDTYQTSTDDTSTASASGDHSTAAGAGATASGDSSTAIGAGSTASGDNSVAIGAGSIATEANSVSVGSVGNERTVTNVAPGVNGTDAVNVDQLDEAIESAKNWSKNYVDQRFESVDRDLNRIGNRANAGVASAIAMASLPQAYQPNQNAAGVALGSFHGETGIAVGVSAISESGRYVLKLNATTNSRGDAGAGVGAAVVW